MFLSHFNVFQAAKNAKPILVPVILMNGTRILIEADTATTVNELCTHVSERVGMTDRSGFSIYVTLGNRVSIDPLRSKFPKSLDGLQI